MARLLVTLLGCAACGAPSPIETADLWAGVRELEAGNAREALDRFDRVDVSPHPALLLNRGLALHQLGQEAPALIALDEAIELATEPALRARVLTDRGTVRARAGRTNDAIADYRAALRLDPADVLARHNLELLLRVLRDELAPDAGVDSDDGEGFALDQLGPSPAVDLATVLLSPDPGRGVLDAYWRWTTYDTFDGRRWSARAAWTTEPRTEPRGRGPTTVQTITLLRRSDAALFGLWGSPPQEPPSCDAAGTGGLASRFVPLR